MSIFKEHTIVKGRHSAGDFEDFRGFIVSVDYKKREAMVHWQRDCIGKCIDESKTMPLRSLEVVPRLVKSMDLSAASFMVFDEVEKNRLSFIINFGPITGHYNDCAPVNEETFISLAITLGLVPSRPFVGMDGMVSVSFQLKPCISFCTNVRPLDEFVLESIERHTGPRPIAKISSRLDGLIQCFLTPSHLKEGEQWPEIIPNDKIVQP
jgi:hypothetical protein